MSNLIALSVLAMGAAAPRAHEVETRVCNITWVAERDWTDEAVFINFRKAPEPKAPRTFYASVKSREAELSFRGAWEMSTADGRVTIECNVETADRFSGRATNKKREQLKAPAGKLTFKITDPAAPNARDHPEIRISYSWAQNRLGSWDGRELQFVRVESGGSKPGQ